MAHQHEQQMPAPQSQPVRKESKMRFWLVIMLLGLCMGLADQAAAQTHDKEWDGVAKHISVPLYKSRVIKLDQPAFKVSVGNESIADILVMRSRQVYVLGKGLGTTNVLLWDRQNRLTHSLDIEVTPDVDTLKAKLFEILPDEKIQVRTSQGSVVLSGEVSSMAAMDTALKLAESFAGSSGEVGQSSNVMNLMSVGGAQQVMLKVTVAEMSRSVIRNLGVRLHSIFTSNSGRWTSGAVNSGVTDATGALGALGIEDKGLFTQYMDSQLQFNLALEAAKINGNAKVLAEPTLTTLTGQEAEFLSGGEFPIPVPDEDGITIDFKEFGIGLRFLPVVLDSGKINLALNVSVSELTALNAVTLSNGSSSTGTFVPGLSKRSARSTVELGDGQTIGIAGLISERMRDSVDKFPGLGDVPVLGQLFRSQSFEKGETELVILVTPTLAQPFDQEQITRLPGDGFIEANDALYYLLGQTYLTKSAIAEANAEPAMQGTATGEISEPEPALVIPLEGGSEGVFGHSLDDSGASL